MKHKKIILLLFVLIAGLLIIFFSINPHFTIKPFFSTKSLFAKSVVGEVIKTNDNYFTIITDDDLIYNFKNDENFSFKLGEKIKIIYENDISLFNEIQDVSISNIQKIDNYKFNENDLFYEYYDDAIKYVDKLSIEEKVGQLLLARVPYDFQTEYIKKYNLGGYILFDRDIKNKTKEELINTISSYQNVSKTPLLIASDEEGGTVTRISRNTNLVSEKFLSPQDLFNISGYESIKEDTINKSRILSELGINMNLAPVADVCTDSNSFIYYRSFGKDASQTSEFIKTVISNTSKDVSYTLKHFAGYGNNLDTHNGISIDKRSYQQLQENDFLPFKAGIDAGVPAILMSHNTVLSMDENYPTSLSAISHNILRKELNFSGVILTDDLSMGAISSIDGESPYVIAVLSGNNLLIVSDIDIAYNDIYNAVKDGKIAENLIDKLLIKTIAFKYYKGLL